MNVNKQPRTISLADKATLEALSALSDMPIPVSFHEFFAIIEKAPDPETAVRQLLQSFSVHSEVLKNKWKAFITDVWFDRHPHVAPLPNWNIMGSEAARSPVLKDARAFLEEIERQPAHLTRERTELLMHPEDAQRLALAFPSRLGSEPVPVETEWSLMDVRRMRALLQTLRLVRTVKGRLVPVRTRIERFRSLPMAQQFYVLWHADVYHVDWKEFGGLWAEYMRVIQEYISLFWEAMEGSQAGVVEDRALWSVAVLETFLPVWDEEGMLDISLTDNSTIQLMQQQALPTILDRFILRDLFERHGLITIKEEFGYLSKFTWTSLGAKVVAAESMQEMPCGQHLLDAEGGDSLPDLTGLAI